MTHPKRETRKSRNLHTKQSCPTLRIPVNADAKENRPPLTMGGVLTSRPPRLVTYMLNDTTRKVKRVAIFVDGNNLFHRVHHAGWFDVLWTDLRALGELIIERSGDRYETVYVKHFTARPRDVDGGKLRPELWVAATTANKIHGNVENILGRFVRRGGSRKFEEKETDANLAAHLCLDAAQGQFDTAVVITADTDFVGALRYLREKIPSIAIILGMPPVPFGVRISRKLTDCADAHTQITWDMLRRCTLPDVVVDPKTRKEYRKPTKEQWETPIGSAAHSQA